MQRNSAEIFAEIAELEKYNPRGSRDSGLWFSEHDWDNEIIPCINEMKQKYNIPFDAIPEPEQPITDEPVENKIIFFENPNELKKIDLDFHKIEIKQPTELQIKMSKSVKALNELVSYSPFSQGAELHFAPQDWKDYIYYEAVSFQRQTKSKNPVAFLPEIWGLIKQFLLPSTEEVEAKRISGREELEKVFSAFSLPPLKQGRRNIYRDTPSPIRDALFTKTRVLIDNEYYENVLKPWVMPYYKDAYLSKIFNNDLEDFVEGYRIQLSSGSREYDCLYVMDAYLKGVSIQIPIYIKDINTSSPLAMRHSVEYEDEDEDETETLSEIFKTLPIRTYEPLLKELLRGCTEFNCW